MPDNNFYNSLQINLFEYALRSKMYAYIDESGNTGENLFDENQPTFWCGALMTQNDFDITFALDIKLLCSKIGTDTLHANEMGIGKISLIADSISKILEEADAKIHICKIDKKDLAATKLFDTLFDSGENLSVPWHVYNLRQMRLLLLFKFCILLDVDLLKEFWGYYLKSNEQDVNRGLNQIFAKIRSRVEMLPDKRSKKLIVEALDWATENPEAIYAHSVGKLQRQSHFPNVVAFPEILKAIDNRSKIWNSPILKIKHDRQDQFKSCLEYWHQIFANASDTPIYLIGEEELILRRAANSDLVFLRDSDSVGIQVVDIILWITKKLSEGQHFSKELDRLFYYLEYNTSFYELSLNFLNYYLSDFINKLELEPLSAEALSKGKKLLKDSEKRKQKKMREYVKQKILSNKSTT